MPGADGTDKNGRVKTAEFYQMQIKMRDDMNSGFTKITEKISGVRDELVDVKIETVAMASQVEIACKQAEKNHDDITSIKRRSNVLDAGVLVVSAVWTGIIALATGNK